MKIAIIGAGVSGLTIAALLNQAKHDDLTIEIYERDKSASQREQGYAISLHQHQVLEVLKQLGIYHQLVNQEHSQQISHVIFYNEKGANIFSTAGMSAKETSFRVQRSQLKNALIEKIGDIPIYYDHQICEFNKINDSTEIVFSSAARSQADLILACDGASSIVRKQLINDLPHYLGLSSIYGVSHAKIPHHYLQGGYAIMALT